MGHTLVAVPDARFQSRISTLLPGTNKIPFGRLCDRDAANAALPYHITLYHWGRGEDAVFLPKLENVRFSPCQAIITGSGVMCAEEGSALAYLSVSPGEGFAEMEKAFGAALGMPPPVFLHMTLAVGMEGNAIREVKRRMDGEFQYPLSVTIAGCGLFHIWTPVYESRRFAP